MADVLPFVPKSSPASDTAVDGTPIIFSEEAIRATPVHEYVWTCARCACQCFQLLESGTTLCVRCGHRSCDDCGDGQTNWRSRLADLPLNLEDVPPLTHKNTIIDQKPTPLILQGFIKGVKEEDPVAVFMIRRDGSMRMWCEGVHNDAQEDWFRVRLERVTNYILERVAPETET